MTPQLNDTYDVVVVGMGPAGSLSAHQLAQAGLTVLGVERATFPRYKVCGGCLNANALKALRRVGVDLTEVSGPTINRFIGSFGRREVRLPLPGGVAISRASLDAHLAREAGRAGATVCYDTVCSELRRDESTWRVTLDTCEERLHIRARAVVGADGLSGMTRKAGGRFQTEFMENSRVGAGTLLNHAGDYEPGAIYMAVGPSGYVGLTVVEEGCLNVAAALDPKSTRGFGSPALVARSILEHCGLAVPKDLINAPWKGTPPLSQTTRPVSANGLFLLGDAAGYVEPFTGEGMAWALEGARQLAPIIVQAIKTGVAGAEDRWNRRYAQRFSGAQRRCRLISKGLRSTSITVTVAEVLGAMPSLAKPVIAQLNATDE